MVPKDSDGQEYREDHEVEMVHRREEIELRMESCDPTDSSQCRSLTSDAAREANETFMEDRFGVFESSKLSIVYCNMGFLNEWVHRAFREAIHAYDVEDIAAAKWPDKPGLEDRYTWAIMIDDPRGQLWRDLAAECFVRGRPQHFS